MSESSMCVPLLTFAALCSCNSHYPASADRLHIQPSPYNELRRVFSTSDVGTATQGQGILDHRMLHISGALQFVVTLVQCASYTTGQAACDV